MGKHFLQSLPFFQTPLTFLEADWSLHLWLGYISLIDLLNQTGSCSGHFLFATNFFSTEHHNQPLVFTYVIKISEVSKVCWIKITLLVLTQETFHSLTSPAKPRFLFLL